MDAQKEESLEKYLIDLSSKGLKDTLMERRRVANLCNAASALMQFEDMEYYQTCLNHIEAKLMIYFTARSLN